MSRIINAITEMGHNPALLAKLDQIEAERGGLRTELHLLDAADPPAPFEITDDIDALIQTAARDIERVISGGTHPDALRLREMVRGMIERITINRHEIGAIEVDVRGAFAGVMQAAGLVERHSLNAVLRTTKAPGLVGSGASLSVVAGARNQLELLISG